MHSSRTAAGAPALQEDYMILKIAIAVGVALVVLVCIPSLIATCSLLLKSLGALGEKRQRRALYYRR